MQSRDIILIAAEPWENYTWRRRHHVAWALSKTHKILFVEPPYSVLSPWKDRNIHWKQSFNLGRLKHQGRNLYSYSPFKILPLSLPFSKEFNYEGLNRRMVIRGLKKSVTKLGIKNPILWVYFSLDQYDYYGLLDEKLVIGDIYDKFTAPTWDCVPPEYIQVTKKKRDLILKKSDIVFAVSQELFHEISKEHSYAHLIPNGVDYESFSNSTQYESPEIIKMLSKPLLGFLGMLHYTVDFELLDYITKGHPEWTLLLMGRENIHVDADREVFNKLKKRKNVIWFGEIDRKMIPPLLRVIDVGLVPHKKLEHNRYATAPLKMWEYFAAGKPIVAVDQGVTPEYSDLIRYADSKIEFERSITKALKEDVGKELVERRKNIAKENSWTKRIDQMIKIIEERLQE